MIQPEQRAGQASANRTRVLLVEDYANLARLLALALTGHGYDVRVACDCASALALAASEHFDLVVSDLGLPDGDGCGLISGLGERGVRKAIALSGSADPDAMQASRAAGFAEHLVKPLDPDDLHAAIQRVLRDPASNSATASS